MNKWIKTVSAKLKLSGDQVEYLVKLLESDQEAALKELDSYVDLGVVTGYNTPEELDQIAAFYTDAANAASILAKLGRKPYPRGFDRVTKTTQS